MGGNVTLYFLMIDPVLSDVHILNEMPEDFK